MSEVDVNGDLLRTFTDLNTPWYLSIDSKGDIMVADCYSHRILLLNSQLCLECILINTDSQIQLRDPRRFYFNELTSELHVLHRGSSRDDWEVPPNVISSLVVKT